MPGITALRKVQIGTMALNGTTDIPTFMWTGTGVIDDIREVVFPEENVGIIGGSGRSYTSKTGAEITLEEACSFEELPYILNSAIYSSTATTDTGVGTGLIRTWNMQTVSTDLIASSDIAYLVIEGGDNQQAEIMRSGFVRELTFSGSQGEAVMVSALVEGQGVTTTTYTAGLTTLSGIETILTSKGKIWIDPSSDTIGTTQKSATLLSFELTMNPTGWQPIPVGDGNLYFTSVKFVGNQPELQVTFEHDATATAEIAAWRAETERALRLQFEGTALTAAGAYTYKTLRFDLYGKWMEFEPLDDQDGNNVVTGTFRVAWSTAASKKGTIVLVNETVAPA
jgi:hypothetical protein